jgi:predicted nucleic acid-binding protein
MRPNLLTPTCGSSLLGMRPPFRLSVMSRFSGYHQFDDEERQYLEALYRLAQVLPLSQAVLDQAVTLRQQRKMSLGDALVAGTALVHGLTLVTRNVEDFHWIQGLSLLNPFDTAPPQEPEQQE